MTTRKLKTKSVTAVIFILILAVTAAANAENASCLGRALVFDGGSDGFGDVVFVGPEPELQITGDLTLEVRARFDSLPPMSTCSNTCPPTSECSSLPICAPNFLVTNGLGGFEVASQNVLYWFGIQANRTLRDRWEAFSGKPDVDVISSIPAPAQAGEWHHYAVTRDTSKNEVRFYVDGVQLGATQVYLASPNGGSQAEVVIGASKSVFGNFSGHFSGGIDDVRVWNTVRSTAEILAHKDSPLTGTESHLVGYWPMDEAGGQVVEDSTSFSNDAVLGESIQVAADDPSRIDCCTFVPNDLPLIFSRTAGAPRLESVQWDSCGGMGVLAVEASLVTSAFVYLNGDLIWEPSDFRVRSVQLEAPITLKAGTNILQVELRGKPGATLSVDLSPSG